MAAEGDATGLGQRGHKDLKRTETFQKATTQLKSRPEGFYRSEPETLLCDWNYRHNLGRNLNFARESYLFSRAICGKSWISSNRAGKSCNACSCNLYFCSLPLAVWGKSVTNWIY